ncbi:MAG TPA: NAD(P)H-dependent oxidoreductase [Candidatus Competibacteraceae bacterium]|nr:NAD(P)H-dependent oxidoreductase [Candidatus Competibacteraceae bacterium]
MARHIVIIQGHPDSRGNRFGHALAAAYAQGAEAAGHELNVIEVARLDFPLLRSKEDFEQGTPPDTIRQAQDAIAWAEHLVIFYPLWLGTMPALLKAFLEQVFRPGFAIGKPQAGKMPKKLLAGKTARIVVTMGMPAFIYRWYFRAHSLKSLKRNILGLSGIGPIKESLIGMIEASDDSKRQKWLAKMRDLGSRGR